MRHGKHFAGKIREGRRALDKVTLDNYHVYIAHTIVRYTQHSTIPLLK